MDSELLQISQNEFKLFSKLVYEKTGITLPDHKISLVQNRLVKRVKNFNLNSFNEYYDLVINDKSGKELIGLTDAISTNVTHFFRENEHFVFMKEKIIPEIKDNLKNKRSKKIRIWCAAASSGEEPYTILMTALENFESTLGVDLKLLGSDISTKVLAIAEKGEYSEDKMKKVGSFAL